MTSAMLAGAAGAAPVGPRRAPLPLAGVITRPDWLSKPTGDDVARHYPNLARALLLDGVAIIRCKVDTTGLPQDCAIESEQPAGFGFGDASLELAKLFRMKPQTVDGVPVAGAEIRVPINFRQVADPPEPPLALGPAPTPAARALAERLAAADRVGPVTAAGFNGLVQRLRQETASVAVDDPAPREAALDAFSQAVEAAPKMAIEREADILAHALPEDVLKQAVAFFESPAGKAWTAKEAEINRARRRAQNDIFEATQAAAKTILCKKIACASLEATAEAQGAKP